MTEEITRVERQEGRGWPAPAAVEPVKLSPTDRELYGYPRDAPGGELDPEHAVVFWRHASGWSVRVLDDHAGEAPTLGEAVRVGALACFETTGHEGAPGAVDWWAAEGDRAPVRLCPGAPGTAAAFRVAWAEYVASDVHVSVSLTLTREGLADVRAVLADEVRGRHEDNREGGACELVLQALADAGPTS